MWLQPVVVMGVKKVEPSGRERFVRGLNAWVGLLTALLVMTGGIALIARAMWVQGSMSIPPSDVPWSTWFTTRTPRESVTNPLVIGTAVLLSGAAAAMAVAGIVTETRRWFSGTRTHRS